MRQSYERQEEFKEKETKYKIKSSEENSEIKDILTKPETIQKDSLGAETQTNMLEMIN